MNKDTLKPPDFPCSLVGASSDSRNASLYHLKLVNRIQSSSEPEAKRARRWAPCIDPMLHSLTCRPAGAVYICTEDSFPIRRLQQLIRDQSCLRSDVPPSLISRLQFSDHIYIEHAADLVSVSR